MPPREPVPHEARSEDRGEPQGGAEELRSELAGPERAAPDASSLHALDALHEELAELFLQHQELLLAFDVDAAAEALERYAAALNAHLRFEEEHLLPPYADPARCPDVPKRARAEVFRLEHAKILALLDDVRARVVALRRSDGTRPPAREVLATLEREATFKGLVHHHEQRETLFQFPILDACLSAEERAALLAESERTWRAARR